MNCPKCRRGLDYEASLSTPSAKDIKDKQLVYFCSSCLSLYIFKQITTKTARGGVLVMSLANIKRAGYLESKDTSSALSGGHIKIEQGMVSDLKKTKAKVGRP